MQIDAHHHLWQYDPGRYGWIGAGMESLQRDFTSDDLAIEMEAVGIDRAVTVQALQEVAETQWLLEEARGTPEILGVVGWVDLAADDLERHLDPLARDPLFVGLRHVLQDEPDEAYMLRDDFNRGVARLHGLGLTYDILIYPDHLQSTLKFVDRHPHQIFVLDHMAKPRIRDGEMSPWREGLTELARRSHCYCKMSGLVTEAEWSNWTPDDIRPYLDVAFEAFGPERLMFGSDWPVCLLAAGYSEWYYLVDEYTSALSLYERDQIWGKTAAEAYRLTA